MAHDPKLRPHLQKVIAETKRPHKYGATAVTIDGIRFASKKEGKRYAELKLLAKAGEINGLEIQPALPVQSPNGTLIFTYKADFSYWTKGGQRVIEDVKGVRTPVYLLKKKIIEALYGFEIVEI
jgi:hypothetical protein